MTIHKKFAFSVVSFACAIVMWQAMKSSCPPKEQHLQAVTSVVERAVDRIFEERVVLPEESKELAEYLSSTVIPQAVEKLTRQRIDFTSYGIVSLGKIIVPDGEDTPVSLGLFGNVYTISEDDAYDYINGLIKETDIENILQQLNSDKNGSNIIEGDEGQ